MKTALQFSSEFIKPVYAWAQLNHPHFKKNGFGRRFYIFKTLEGPEEIWEIKRQIITFANLENCPQEENYRDFCGYITEGGAIHHHRDGTQNNKVHARFNVMISKPLAGGVPVQDNVQIEVNAGEMWRNNANLQEHWCTPVIGTIPRVVLSFGFLI